MVAGLETPTSGKVYIGERDVTDLEPQDRDVSMVFQSYALYPHKSVFDNIGFPLKLRGVAREDIDRRVRDVASRLGIGPLLDRRPGELSGGQRQRVALGRALVRKPTVFLLDEPLSNLDAQLRTGTRAEIKRLHTEFATTALYVTHDQVEAMTLSDRIAVMKDGELQQIGTPEEIYRTPANRFVAGFVGNPSMNFVGGRIETGTLSLSGMEVPLSAGHVSQLSVSGTAVLRRRLGRNSSGRHRGRRRSGIRSVGGDLRRGASRFGRAGRLHVGGSAHHGPCPFFFSSEAGGTRRISFLPRARASL